MDLCNPSEIKTLLESNGFHFSQALGQNFLIEGRVPLKIAEGAGIDETFGVLEIGPGIGALTKRLSERAGKVVVRLFASDGAPVSEDYTIIIHSAKISVPGINMINGEASPAKSRVFLRIIPEITTAATPAA